MEICGYIWCVCRPLEMQKQPEMTTAVDSGSTLRSASTKDTKSLVPTWGHTFWKSQGWFFRWKMIQLFKKIIVCVCDIQQNNYIIKVNTHNISFVLLQSENERNYHIFYQMCACANQPEFKSLRLCECFCTCYLTLNCICLGVAIHILESREQQRLRS